MSGLKLKRTTRIQNNVGPSQIEQRSRSVENRYQKPSLFRHKLKRIFEIHSNLSTTNLHRHPIIPLRFDPPSHVSPLIFVVEWKHPAWSPRRGGLEPRQSRSGTRVKGGKFKERSARALPTTAYFPSYRWPQRVPFLNLAECLGEFSACLFLDFETSARLAAALEFNASRKLCTHGFLPTRLIKTFGSTLLRSSGLCRLCIFGDQRGYSRFGWFVVSKGEGYAYYYRTEFEKNRPILRLILSKFKGVKIDVSEMVALITRKYRSNYKVSFYLFSRRYDVIDRLLNP